MTTAASVLRDASLLRLITSFQGGLPRDLQELLDVDCLKRDPGALPRLALQRHDFRLLQRLHRLHCEQKSYFQWRRLRAMSLDRVWLDALALGDVEAAAWIAHQPTIPSDHSPPQTLQAACASGQIAAVEWLLTRYPEWRHELTPACVASCPTVELFQWLEQQIDPFPCSTDAMDEAATHGRLELVRYLHGHRSEGCTSRAMDGAASNGHLAVVKFLHTHRSEGATTQAIAGAAEHGHLQVVQYLSSNGITESSVLPISKAALYGHTEVVQYLHTKLPPALVGLRSKSCRPRIRKKT